MPAQVHVQKGGVRLLSIKESVGGLHTWGGSKDGVSKGANVVLHLHRQEHFVLDDKDEQRSGFT